MSDMKGAPKAPRPVIEQSTEADESSRPRVEREVGADEARSAFHDTTVGFFSRAGQRAWDYADAHPHTVLYAGVGLLLAVLILWLGLWHALVIAIFVVVGAAIGQARDGEGGIYRFFRRIFGGRG